MMVDRVLISIPCSKAAVGNVCPYSFSTKNGPQMGSTGGGDKRGPHLKDKFFRPRRRIKMRAWGIKERQSDYGLDLLETIVATQLSAVVFVREKVKEKGSKKVSTSKQ